MAFYDEMQEIATELLTEFNQGAMQYVKIVPGSGPKDNPGPATPTPYSINGVAKGVTKRFTDSGLAVATDLEVIAAVDSRYTPDMKDKLKINGVDHKIKHIEPKPATGTVAAYLFVVGRL